MAEPSSIAPEESAKDAPAPGLTEQSTPEVEHDSSQTSKVQDAPAKMKVDHTTSTSPASAGTPAIPNPISSLQSLWSNLPWGSTNGANSNATRSTENPEWLTGAQTIFTGAVQGAMDGANKAVIAASEVVQAVDRTMLDDGLAHLRVASDQLVRDVKEGVAALSEDAATTDTSPAAIFESLRTQTKEAMDLFNDKPPSSQSVSAGRAPWDADALPEAERKHAGALRERMLKLVVDGIYSRAKRESAFLSGRARREGFAFDAQDLNGTEAALGVLEADPNVRRLRAGLVPAKMKEEDFWAEYFWHVRHTRRLLLAHGGKLPEEKEDVKVFEKDNEDESAVAETKSEEVTDDANEKQSKPVKREDSESDGVKDWDKEIDEIFDSKDD